MKPCGLVAQEFDTGGVPVKMTLAGDATPKISDIAGQSGFNDISHFNHCFRRLIAKLRELSQSQN